MWSELPYDTIYVIFSYLQNNDINNIIATSKNWEISKLARSDVVWKPKYEAFISKKRGVDRLKKNERKRLDEVHSFFEKYQVVRIAFVMFIRFGKLHEYRNIKIVLIGDAKGNAGKTCLLIRYCQNKFLSKWVPTIFDNKIAKVRYCMLGLNLWDTASEEDYDTLRSLSYQETDVFILCFDVTNRKSLINLKEHWYPNITRWTPVDEIENNTNLVYPKFILCGTKCDLRNDKEMISKLHERNEKFVDPQEAQKFGEELGVYCYIETNAKNRKNIDELFIFCLDSVFRCDDNEEDQEKRKFSFSSPKRTKKGSSGCKVM